ncbi:transmembrane protein, putative [Medicago truncatula]|uniref:Transmembrane protein, putative n=1 Tax=Medicago truncatula TaxID=3880 RepID=G7KCW8_MEDTR|nr:transmembrane protein, putative [Medicago truncatula]
MASTRARFCCVLFFIIFLVYSFAWIYIAAGSAKPWCPSRDFFFTRLLYDNQHH